MATQIDLFDFDGSRSSPPPKIDRQIPKGWEEYFLWNDAIADYVFSPSARGLPVFLGLEDTGLREIARTTKASGDPAEELTRVVRATLALPPIGRSAFFYHRDLARAWRLRGDGTTPPSIGVLALFSLVAERMVGDEQFRANNYLGRLCQWLEISDEDDQRRFGAHFRNDTPLLWDTLNGWLDDLEGARGIATARAFDWRKYVGVPISQALVREQDRRRLPSMFRSYGLQPNQRISVADMSRLLADWISPNHVSPAMLRLWRGDNKSRIAEIACIELESWDGRSQERKAGEQLEARLDLVAELRLAPRPELRMQPLVRAAEGLPPTDYRPREQHGSPQPISGPVSLNHLAGTSWLSICPPEAVDLAQLLASTATLERRAAPRTRLSRKPTRTILLRYRPEEHLYVEVSKAELLERYIVLAQLSFADSLRTALEKIARRGYQELRATKLPGLPASWVAFINVEIERLLETEDDDSALVPLGRAQVTLGGGMTLPGRSTWHASHPPEIRAALLEDQDASIAVNSLDLLDGGRAVELDLGRFRGSTAKTLSDARLPDGDYEAVLQQPEKKGKSGRLASARFRLRSAAHPQPITQAESICHCLSRKRPVELVAPGFHQAPEEPVLTVRGAALSGKHDDQTDWIKPRGEVPSERFAGSGLPEEQDSDLAPVIDTNANVTLMGCIAGEAHIRVCPPWRAGVPRAKVLRRSYCKNCGLEAWHQPRAKKSGTKKKKDKKRFDESRAQRAPVATHQEGIADANQILDALSYAVSGSWQSFRRIVAHSGSEPWLPHELARSFMALAHTDFALDRHSLHPIAWQIAPSVLSILPRSADGEHRAILCGARSDHLVARLREDIESLGGKLAVRSSAGSPSLVEFSCLAPEEIKEVASSSSDAVRTPIQVVEDFSDRLSRSLPHISQLLEHLPATAAPLDGLERYSLENGSWVPVDDADTPGAYRLPGLPRRYGVLTQSALGTRRLRLADARTVKHLAAIESGVSLVAYDREKHELMTPLGAELPGLFHRAAALSTGTLPRIEDGYSYYSGVSPALARAIYARLSAPAPGAST